MHNFNQTLDPALTIRGVIKECVRDRHAGRKIANCIVGGLAVVIILAMLQGILWLIAEPQGTVQPPRYVEPPKEQVEKAHRYHGIRKSIYNPATGESYFYRDGGKCSLFAYLKNK